MNLQNIPKNSETGKLFIPDKKTIYFDASSFKKPTCMRRTKWHQIDGLVPNNSRGWASNYKAGYGTAFHKVFQRVLGGMPIDEAISFGVKFYTDTYGSYISNSPFEFRTPEHLDATLRTYFYRQYKSDLLIPMVNSETGGYLSEIKFEYPYYETSEFVVKIVGTIDLIADYAGRICVTDHKVTGARDMEDFFHSFELDIQSRMYVWMYYTLTGQILPFLVNGIFIRKPTEKSMVKGVFDGVVFQRNNPPLEMTKEKIDFFQSWLFRRLDRIIKGYEEGTLEMDYDLSACKELFNQQCIYYNICRLDPSQQDMVLRGGHKVEPYNPLLFQD